MDYLEKNFETLKTVRPFFFEKVKSKYDEGYSEEGIEELDTRDGHKALCIERNGEKVRLNSLFRPLQEAEKWADQYEYQNLSVPVFMFGVGNGTFLRELLKRLREDAIIFLSEPDLSVFLYQLVHQDFSDILADTRVLFFVKSVNEEDFADSLDRFFHWSMIPSQILCFHPGYDRLYHKEYLEFYQKVGRGVELAKVNANTISYMSRNIPVNILRNLHFLKGSNYSIELIGLLPEDVPAIIVSAGPSLDKNIEELKNAVGKAFILATDTSVKYLIKHGVPFDAMVTLDSKKWPKHFASPKCADVPLMCAMEARDKILENHTGRKIWLRTGVYIEKLFQKVGKPFPYYNTGGCVATACYAVSVAMGARRIILVGQDLAYDGEYTHAGGGIARTQNGNKDIFLVEGIDGKPVRSRGDWTLYREWFEQAAEMENAPEVIDATEGGALIKGTKIMKLSEAIEQYCKTPFDFKEILDNMPPTFNDNEYALVKRECEKLDQQFTQIRQKATEGIKLANDLIKLAHQKKPNIQEHRKAAKLKKINQYIGSQDANDLLDIYTSAETEDDIGKINVMTEDESKNAVQSFEIAAAVYKSFVKAVDELRPILEESLRKM